MKNKLRVLFLTVLFFALMTAGGCKTEFIWDPTGIWAVNITYLGYGNSYVETFNLTGSETGGTISGYTVYGVLPAQNGTYTVTGDYSIHFDFDFWGYGSHLTFSFIGNSTEVNPNLMTGTGEWYINGILENNLSWAANKTTNLQ